MIRFHDDTIYDHFTVQMLAFHGVAEKKDDVLYYVSEKIINTRRYQVSDIINLGSYQRVLSARATSVGTSVGNSLLSFSKYERTTMPIEK